MGVHVSSAGLFCRNLALATGAVFLFAPPAARAWEMTDDFEAGILLDWEREAGRAGEIVDWRGNSMLQVPAGGRMRYLPADSGRGVAAAEVLDGGGLRVGGDATVMLMRDDGGSLVVHDRTGRELGRVSGLGAALRRRLEVVYGGTLLRVFVDGRAVFETLNAPSARRSPLVLIGGTNGSLFDNVRVTDSVSPVKGTLAIPDHERLVFSAAAPVRLRLSSMNQSGSSATVLAAVRSFRGVPVDEEPQAPPGPVIPYGVQVPFRIATDRATAVGAGETGIDAGYKGARTLELGTIPPGFYMLELSYAAGKHSMPGATYPLAVLAQPSEREYTAPAFPVGVYLKMMNYRRHTDPLWWRTYIHAMAHDLAEKGFNAVVACGGFDDGEIGIYNRYGLAGISRGEAWMDHPGVIGSFLRDEPKPGEEMAELQAEYAALREMTDKALTTCMVGEGIGLGGPADPIHLWKQLEASPRMFRWYGIKKHHYDILFPLRYKGTLSFESLARIVEAANDAPWWLVAPAFGDDKHEAYFQNPDPAQLTGLMHLACAHGADGLMLYQHQAGLVDPVTLRPRDGKFAAAGEAAAWISRHGGLLRRLRYGYFEVRNADPVRVAAVPRRSDEGRAYLYVVNKDGREPVSTRLTLGAGKPGPIRDLVSGRTFEAAEDADGMPTVEFALDSGRAALLDLEATVSPPAPARPWPGPVLPSDELVDAARTAVAEKGVAVMRILASDTPCLPGDAIGLSRADDPRHFWRKRDAGPCCLSWSGTLHPRSAQGFLSFESALRIAEADAGDQARWTVLPAAGASDRTPGELRAMLHLALAYGNRAVLLPRDLPPDRAAVADEVAALAAEHGERLSELRHGGLDIRCKNPAIAPVPRAVTDAAGENHLYVYAVNLDTNHETVSELLLWADTWTWTTARDLFAEADLVVHPPDEEGYVRCPVVLGPGEGKLIALNAAVKKRR